MTYLQHFEHADVVMLHWSQIVPSISDPLLRLKYVGFATIAGVTVYELAIKQILMDFAAQKHRVLGVYCENQIKRINGRIKLKDLKDDYIGAFGDKYRTKFVKKLEARKLSYLRQHQRDIKNSYGNMITWRHQFAHEGHTNANATFEEVVQAYADGKEVIHCLASTMQR